MRIIPDSELIINSDGSVFHLHIKPEQLSDKIIMMGDPERVTLTASFFDSIECDIQNREFHTITGTYKGKRITALSENRQLPLQRASNIRRQKNRQEQTGQES